MVILSWYHPLSPQKALGAWSIYNVASAMTSLFDRNLHSFSEINAYSPFYQNQIKTHIRKDLGMPDLHGSDEKLKLILGSKTKGKKQSELTVR